MAVTRTNRQIGARLEHDELGLRLPVAAAGAREHDHRLVTEVEMRCPETVPWLVTKLGELRIQGAAIFRRCAADSSDAPTIAT
jgi:hypothetical protein